MNIIEFRIKSQLTKVAQMAYRQSFGIWTHKSEHNSNGGH